MIINSSLEFDPATAQRLQWLEDFLCLTHRDAALLRLVDRVGVLSLDQIRRIWWPGGQQTTWKRLYQLRQHGLIQYPHFEGVRFRPEKQAMIPHGLVYSKSLFTLTPLGQAWLVKHGQGPAVRPLNQAQLIHQLLLAEITTRLAEAVHQRGSEWMLDWYGQYQAGLFQAGQPICQPPGLGVISGPLGAAHNELLTFIHLDLDSEGTHVRSDSAFARQIAGYEELLQRWTAHPLLRDFQYFPAVLWIIEANKPYLEERRLQNLVTSLRAHRKSWIGYALARRSDLFASPDILTAPAWVLLLPPKPSRLIGLEPGQRQPLLNKEWLMSLTERAYPSTLLDDNLIAPVGRVTPVSVEPVSVPLLARPVPPPPASPPPVRPAPLDLLKMGEPEIVPLALPPRTPPSSSPAAPKPEPAVSEDVSPGAPFPVGGTPPAEAGEFEPETWQVEPDGVPLRLAPRMPGYAPSPEPREVPLLPPSPPASPPPPPPPAISSPSPSSPIPPSLRERVSQVRRKFMAIPATHGHPSWRDNPLGLPGSGQPPWPRPAGLLVLEAKRATGFFVEVISAPLPWPEWLVAYETLYENSETARRQANQGVVVLLPDLATQKQLERAVQAQPPRRFKIWVAIQADFEASSNVLGEAIYTSFQRQFLGGVKIQRTPLLA